jgi:hypothetical protein
LLTLLDTIDSPVILHSEAADYPAAELAGLRDRGILCPPSTVDRIPRPKRFGPGPDVDVIDGPTGPMGITDDDDFHYEPIPLTDEDTWEYSISIPHLVDVIRRDNGITARGFRNDAGLIPIGTKSVNNAGAFSVYLSRPNEDEQAVLARCARLKAPDVHQNAVLLLPSGPAFSPEARRVLSDIQVLSLWESAERGTLTLDWTSLLTSFHTGGGTARVFRKDGEIWTLTFDRNTVYMRDAKGLFYMRELLRCPGQQISAVTLTSAAAGDPGRSIALGSAGEILSDPAILKYRERRAELDSEIETAERNCDLGRKETLEEEREQIDVQLRSALGRGGRRRRASDDVERVRKAVSKAISEAIIAIRKQHRPLADHLQRFIDRGRQLSYTGDGTPWNF